MISAFFCSFASAGAVLPCELPSRTPAPCRSSTRTSEASPEDTACCKGVMPNISFRFTSAPRSSMASTVAPAPRAGEKKKRSTGHHRTGHPALSPRMKMSAFELLHRASAVVLGILLLLDGTALAAPAAAGAASEPPVQEGAVMPPGHWVYDALNLLSQDGIYTGGTYSAHWLATRQELAASVSGMLNDLFQGPKAASGAEAVRGPVGPPTPEQIPSRQVPAELGPADRKALGHLLREFSPELNASGTDVRDLERRLDELSARLQRLKRAVARTPALRPSNWDDRSGQRSLSERTAGALPPGLAFYSDAAREDYRHTFARQPGSRSMTRTR